jgi:YidC/Oxa1 family membrane protein insertase
MWDLLILQPMLNGLLMLYQLLFNNLTLAITALTLLIRAITFPLTYQQQKASKRLMELQQSDAWKKIQEKYAKERDKLAQEQMKLYQEAGVNPLGSCLPLLIQFPVLIGLYQAITQAMAASPVQLLDLSRHLYKFLPNVASIIPLNNQFLWLNLGLPDPFYVLPLLVVATTWLQSKIMTPISADPQAAQTSQTMALTTTVMVGFFSLQFPSGLSIYWIVGNIIGILQQSLTTPVNWKNVFNFRFSLLPAQPAEETKGKRKKK